MGMMETAFAEQLATSLDAVAAAARAEEYLSFRLGTEEYGIDILTVQEIRGYPADGGVTRLANAPEFIKGVIDLRGVIVPLVDLRVKFGLDEARYDALTVVIILNVGGRVVGAVVDSVSDVLQLPAAQVRPPPQFNSLLDAGVITGLASVPRHGADARERLLILLDIERLMLSADMGLAR
jgi:purine-binding chemotaxis protein CheW